MSNLVLVIYSLLLAVNCNTKYGVILSDYPKGKFGVKYLEPKSRTVLRRPYSGNIKPKKTIHDVSYIGEPIYEPMFEELEPIYELVYEPVPRNIPEYTQPEAQHHVIHIHHHNLGKPYLSTQK